MDAASPTSPASPVRLAPLLPRGRIKERPEDFIVEELPAYEPSGVGEHVFVRFTKTGRTTLDAVRALSRALGCDARASGFGGMKDRHAVTTQTISLQTPRGTKPAELAERARALGACAVNGSSHGANHDLSGIVVHDARPHGNKLKPGHLAGNRFTITVREIPRDRVGEIAPALAKIGSGGVPNAFGAQRFGSRGDNAERALAWLRGDERAPRDPRLVRLLWSSLQSAVFNAVLDARVADGTWVTPLAGDLLKLRSSGGLFGCADVQTDAARAATGEVSPTGPIVGIKMRWPEGVPGELEHQVSDRILGAGFDLARTRALGEGTRRSLRLWVEDLRWEMTSDEASGGGPGQEDVASMRVYFVLPKGAYATTVLAAAFTLDEPRAPESAETAETAPDDA